MKHVRITNLSTTMLLVPAAAILGCLGSCSSAPIPTEPFATHSGRACAAPTPDLGMDRAAMVAPGIYRGSQPTAHDLANLKARGFKTIVNLRSFHSERREVEALGMKAVEIPMRADLQCTAPGDAAVMRFFDTILDPSNQPVYFHCAHGKDRTGTMAALYRIEVDGWSPEEALEEMRAFGSYEGYGELLGCVRNYRPLGIWAWRRPAPQEPESRRPTAKR